MSFRPHFSNANNALTPFNPSNNLGNINIVPQTNAGAFQGSVPNIFPNSRYVNSSHLNRHPLSTPILQSGIANTNVANNVPLPRPPINFQPPLSHQHLMNARPYNATPNFASQPQNVNPSVRLFTDQSCNRNALPPAIHTSTNANFNFGGRNIPVQRFPQPNVTSNNLPPNINYPTFPNSPCINRPRNNPVNLPSLPMPMNQNTTNILNFSTNYSSDNLNISASQPAIFTNSFRPSIMLNSSKNTLPNMQINSTVQPPYSSGNLSIPTSQPAIFTSSLRPPSFMLNSTENTLSNLKSNSTVQPPPLMPQNDAFKVQNLSTMSLNPTHEKEVKLTAFLENFTAKHKENKQKVAIPEFRYLIKAVIRMIKLLNERKSKLSKLLDASDNEWKSEVENAKKEQEQLSMLCSFISTPEQLNNVIEKLNFVKKKRERKKKTKQNKLCEKMRADQKRKERDQEIDKWLDGIKEKNQKIKREAELKKEADFILLEVRRKIYEAKKTIEKIKVFEKLRSARQANATQKGLHVLNMHNAKFEKKMSILKETMLKQLADYEAEEKALKVMLETEQEGQREEEAQWKIKKMRTLQQKKQDHIMECIFGISDDPLPTDPLFLFHKFHTFASSSTESLIQIRHQWDVHISEDGEVIPQHWVVPVAPSDASWEQCLEN